MAQTRVKKSFIEKIVPNWQSRFRQRLNRITRPAWLGTIRRTSPLNYTWGYDRGRPVDRYYIESFLAGHRQDIRGRVLEIMDSRYTLQFGTGVDRRDVLDIDPSNPNATLIADLTLPDGIPTDQFDCFILTQTLQLIFNAEAAVYQAHRLLRPGGVLLVTVPAVSKLDKHKSDFWRFTPAACSILFTKVFGADQVDVKSFGNVLTSVAFLMGMACEELSVQELDFCDIYYPVIVAVRAVKAFPQDVLVDATEGADIRDKENYAIPKRIRI